MDFSAPMRVLFLDTKPNNPNRYIARAAFSALKENDHVSEAVWVEYGNALIQAREQDFDAFIAFDGEEADNFVVRNLAELIPRSAIWFTEDPYETYRNTKVTTSFDLAFSNDRASVQAYGPKGRYLPLAADPGMHRAVNVAEASHDIFFAGTAWPNRLDFLRKLRIARPSLRLNLALVSNAALTEHVAAYADEFSFGRGLAMRDFCSAANRARLTLTLPRAFSTDPDNPTAASDTPGPRFFEVALAGSTQLVDRSIAAAAADFLPSTAFLAYDDFDQCLGLIDRALADEDSLARIAAEAQTVTLERHLYANRIAAIVDELIALEPRPRREPHARPKILIISHNSVVQGWFGGSEIYADHLLTGLDADVAMMAPVVSEYGITEYRVTDQTGAEIDRVVIDQPVLQGDLVHEGFEHEFQALLARHAFDLVHVNHLIRYPVSLLAFAKASGAKVTFSLHDYYLICENFTLLGFEGRYCDIPNRPQATCTICLSRMRDFPMVQQAPRLRMMREMSHHIDRVLYGSEASWSIFSALFPHLQDRGQLLAPPVSVPPQPANRTVPKRLRVAVLGNFSSVKGADTLLKVFEGAHALDISFDIFGRVDSEYLPALARIQSVEIKQHGIFPPGKPPSEIYDCRVALILSPWPETYCMTLSELQMMGIVPITTDIGGQGERVRHEVDGLKVPISDPSAVILALRRLSANPQEIDRMAAALGNLSYDGPAAFAAKADSIFADVVGSARRLTPSQTGHRVFGSDEIGVFLTAKRFITPNRVTIAREPIVADNLMSVANVVAPAHVWRDRMNFSRVLMGRFTRMAREDGTMAAFRRSAAWARFWFIRRVRRR